MTDVQNESLRSELFSMNEEEYSKNYRQHLIEQYKLYVEMTDKVSERRAKANTFFLSVNTLLVTAIGVLSKLQSSFETLNLWWVLVTSFAGVLFCWAWISIIHSYGQLTTGKFKIIFMIEEKLPLALYKTEWAYLKPERGLSRYKQLTVVEPLVPKVFALIYIVLMILATVLLTTSWIAILLN
jgi:hypothetical protein